MTDIRWNAPTADDREVVHVPPGWYADPGGVGMRYWDGAQWTEYQSAPPPNSDPGTTAAPSKKPNIKKPNIWRRHPVLLIVLNFVMGICLLLYAAIGFITVATEDCTRSGFVVECQSEQLTTTVNLFWTGVIAVFGLLALLRGILLLRARKSGTK